MIIFITNFTIAKKHLLYLLCFPLLTVVLSDVFTLMIINNDKIGTLVITLKNQPTDLYLLICVNPLQMSCCQPTAES